MHLKNFAVKAAAFLAVLVACAAVVPSAFADGDNCGDKFKKDDDGWKRCIEAKIDKVDKKAMDSKAVEGKIWESLTDVKIEWKAHPSVCLYFYNWRRSDWKKISKKNPNLKMPQNPVFAVGGCGEDPGFHINIRKK